MAAKPGPGSEISLMGNLGQVTQCLWASVSSSAACLSSSGEGRHALLWASPFTSWSCSVSRHASLYPRRFLRRGGELPVTGSMQTYSGALMGTNVEAGIPVMV